ncbi:MAG: hypothetical protein VW879_13940 [Opitutae bacterium]
MSKSFGTLLNMATYCSHGCVLSTAITVNAAAIAVNTYFVAASVRVASGCFLGGLD